MLSLQEYNFTLKHCKGNNNVVVDALSRTCAEYIASKSFPTHDQLPIDPLQLAVLQSRDLASLVIMHNLP